MPKIISNFSLFDLLDILMVSVLVYYILQWFKGSRAFQLFKGFLFLAFIYVFSVIFKLATIELLLQKLSTIIVVLLIVVFQPELRRGLERLGKHFFLGFLFGTQKGQDLGTIIKLIKACEKLSAQRVGALLVLERTTGLSEYIETGIRLDALVSTELLVSLFQKNSPLHDGAVIIQEDRIAAASCLLPLAEGKISEHKAGTRHRAAVGISEVSDAIVIVVSEETGAISIAENGVLIKALTRNSFKERLLKIYEETEAGRRSRIFLGKR